jgi:hypothetical protein
MQCYRLRVTEVEQLDREGIKDHVATYNLLHMLPETHSE